MLIQKNPFPKPFLFQMIYDQEKKRVQLLSSIRCQKDIVWLLLSFTDRIAESVKQEKGGEEEDWNTQTKCKQMVNQHVVWSISTHVNKVAPFPQKKFETTFSPSPFFPKSNQSLNSSVKIVH